MDTSTASPLCDPCWYLFEAIEAERNSPERHRFDLVVETYHHRSLDSECAFCAAFRFDSSSNVRYEEVTISFREQYLGLEFRLAEQDHVSYPYEFMICRVRYNEKLSTIVQKAALEDNTGNDSVLEVARQWMLRCTSQHGECVKNESPHYYPTRLLEFDTETIRLVERSKTQFAGTYATLSYSWGKDKFKVLTEQILAEFQSGIGLQGLPATFRDAVSVCQKLGIVYLWIDCYCILQDEDSMNEDKQHEMAQMEQVYSNAILNIGAAWASSPMGGLFTQRRSRAPIQITWDSRSPNGNRLHLVYPVDQIRQGNRDFCGPYSSTIFRRAWCLQERFLCPRMLHFCNSGLYWECDAIRTASDSFPGSLPSILGLPDRPPFSIKEGSDYFSPLLPNYLWGEIVSAYSEMELSHPTEDKLVACGGVAKQMAKLMNDEYAAGLFRRDLIKKLTWTMDMSPTDKDVSRSAKPWRAPSWSWASMDGKIRWSFSDAQFSEDVAEACQIISLDCKLADPANPYGALLSAMIRLKGWVADVEVGHCRELTQTFVRCEQTLIVVRFDDFFEPRKGLIILLTTTYAEKARGVFLPLTTDGLVLAPVDKDPSDQTDLYRRVGAFKNQRIITVREELETPGNMTQPFAERVVNIV